MSTKISNKTYFEYGVFLIEKEEMLKLLLNFYNRYCIDVAKYEVSLWEKIKALGDKPWRLQKFDNYVYYFNHDLWRARLDAKYDGHKDLLIVI